MTGKQLKPLLAAVGLVVATLVIPTVGFDQGSRLAAQDVSGIQAEANQLDRLLAEDLPALEQAGVKAPRVSDEAFLRRVIQDLFGRQPTAAELREFVEDDRNDKRMIWVSELLKEGEYGANWSRYWRDVIFYRRTDERGQFARQSTEQYLRNQLNQNASWDEIATEFITATGDAREDGRTGLIVAHGGRPEELVAEISRIFLGIQIQWAQCHDHPTDRWKREQFHELAAFVPRVASRPTRDGERRSVMVYARDAFPRRRNDMPNNRYIGTAEHRMPDLEDPEAPGEIIQPKFFVNDLEVPLGTKDTYRRGFLAEWISDKENPWFATAFVNRMWAQLVGDPLYETIDDIGPDRVPVAPRTVEYLAQQFQDHDYDIKWLVQVIMSTDVYQRELRERAGYGETPFTGNCARRRTADQLFDNLSDALGLSVGFRQRAQFAARFNFDRTFGFDPSEAPEDLASSIPQALTLMNSAAINNALATRRGKLTRLLFTEEDNEAITRELYQSTLGRAPTDQEQRVVKSYLSEVGDRREAFEDLQWSLINSTEFLYRK